MVSEARVLCEPADRGELALADKVISSIVTQVVASVSGSTPASAGIARLLGRSYPRVDVDVAGKHVRVGVETAIAWPQPAAEVCRTVHDTVVREIQHLTGLTVARLDVTARYLPERDAGE